ncbi:MAG TPA: sugar phosphate isomerase/epimerase family protein [Sedimentisphaerales bacterium]|jgi:neutral ceramidase|nr:sugar phosphate isomerase/epimerase family protein [Sedimentisphaerales bacterium]HNU31278.1 sugar phosphate isomerase/epimerase family protein [Sedimentisphaerales bacterium]
MAMQRRVTRREFLDRSVKTGAAGFFATWAASGDVRTTQAAQRSTYQIGCYTRPWDQYEYRVALDAIAEAGYEYCGLMTTQSESHLVISVATTPEEAARVGEEVRNRGLKVASVYGGDIPVAQSLEVGIAGLRKLIDNCAACGATNLLMGGIGDPKLYEPYYKAIAECCDYAGEKGMGISVKPHGGLNATGPQCRKTVEFVGHENFRIWYDPGNIFYYSDAKLNPVDDAPSVEGLVIGMSVKDYKHPKDVSVTPGTGMVDFPTVLAKLKAGGFTGGPLVVECLAPGDLPHTLEEARKARRFLESLTGQKSRDAADSVPAAGPLQAGVAVTDITPPVGYRMCGYFNERLSTGVLNPLHAKALVLRQGDTRAAMVFCDLIGLSVEVSKQAREQIEREVGIPAGNILLAATHSHTGPLYCDALRDHLHAKAVAQHGKDPCEEVDYPSQLVSRIVDAVKEADAKVRPVQAEVATAQQQGLSFNRRFHMKDGTVRFNPGVLNPDIVRAAGPIDPGVGVVLFRDGPTALAGLVNFALHLDTLGGTLYAADYPYYVEQTLRQTLGEDFVLLFGNGTCGDINHIDVTTKDRLKTDTIGTTLGQTVAAALPQSKAVAKPSLAVRRAVVEVPAQQFAPAEIEQARKDMDKIGTSQLSFLDQVRAYKIVDIQSRGSTIPIEVQVFRLGDEVAVVGLPGEVFADLGLAIRKASPFPTTLVIELCQDSVAYIPTRKAFAEGSYETVNSRIAPGGGERMADAAIRLLKELRGL